MAEPAHQQDLKRTALYALNVELGGKIVPFAGYEMPVQFLSGILKEHIKGAPAHARGRRPLRRVAYGAGDPASRRRRALA